MPDQLHGFPSLDSWSSTITQLCGKVFMLSWPYNWHPNITMYWHTFRSIFFLYIWFGVIRNMADNFTQFFRMSLELALLLGNLKGVSMIVIGSDIWYISKSSSQDQCVRQSSWSCLRMGRWDTCTKLCTILTYEYWHRPVGPPDSPKRCMRKNCWCLSMWSLWLSRWTFVCLCTWVSW